MIYELLLYRDLLMPTFHESCRSHQGEMHRYSNEVTGKDHIGISKIRITLTRKSFGS